MPLPTAAIFLSFAAMGDLFDAAGMYDEDYLYFFAAPEGVSKFARHGPSTGPPRHHRRSRPPGELRQAAVWLP